MVELKSIKGKKKNYLKAQRRNNNWKKIRAATNKLQYWSTASMTHAVVGAPGDKNKS